MSGETADVYLSRARLLIDLGHWTDAVEELTFARALAPEDADILALSALVSAHEGRAGEAAEFAAAATDAAPGHDEAIITRAWVLASSDNRAGAVAFAEELLRDFATSAYATLVATALFSVFGGGQLALDAAWEAVRLAPADPDAHWLLARIAAPMGLAQVVEEGVFHARQLPPFPGRRAGVWKLWWDRFGGVESASAGSRTGGSRADGGRGARDGAAGDGGWPAGRGGDGWGGILKVAAVVFAVGLLLAWLAAR
ncbi:hypothetical protein Lfu02_30560 [Longispora fulva]|uniref:Tetratricopeptide (TPR) repeat protein n=1 Tax=Longispora fulva TaxID=619741 RepID=A0A8J7KMI6_9ACTN|nr:hypothetical protein [Longispora fulva]MBG6139191.1 tetratricopeptide (TPR) repeat protein [Longispora fulva]GIG58684.1 hypothetical protein Lfu02_30560 [Longispora fulva]